MFDVLEDRDKCVFSLISEGCCTFSPDTCNYMTCNRSCGEIELPLNAEELPVSMSGPGVCDSGSESSASGSATVEVLSAEVCSLARSIFPIDHGRYQLAQVNALWHWVWFE